MPGSFTKDNARDSLLHSLDVRSKMLLAVCASLTALFLTQPLPLLTLFAVTLIYALHMRRLKVLCTAYLFFVGVMLLSLGCVSLLVHFFPKFKDSMDISTLLLPFLRGSAVMNVVMPMALTIRVQTMLTALKNLHLPFVIYLPGTVMIRFVPAFIADVKQVYEAMKIRGFEPGVGSVLRHPRLVLRLAFTPLVFMSLRTSEDLGVAAELKGIGCGKLRPFHQVQLKKRDYCLMAGSVLLCALCLYLEWYSGGSFYGSIHG